MKSLKAQVRIGAINELGVKYDDMREAAEKDVLRKEGYHMALNELQASTLKSVFARIDADHAEGRFELEVAGFCKDYVMKVHAGIDNLRIMNEKHRLLAEGRVVGLKDAISFAAKVLDTEKAKLKAIESQVAGDGLAAEEGQPTSERRPDTRISALEDLDQRRATARAEAAAASPAEKVARPSIVTSTAPLSDSPRQGHRPKAKGNGVGR